MLQLLFTKTFTIIIISYTGFQLVPKPSEVGKTQFVHTRPVQRIGGNRRRDKLPWNTHSEFFVVILFQLFFNLYTVKPQAEINRAAQAGIIKIFFTCASLIPVIHEVVLITSDFAINKINSWQIVARFYLRVITDILCHISQFKVLFLKQYNVEYNNLNKTRSSVCLMRNSWERDCRFHFLSLFAALVTQ